MGCILIAWELGEAFGHLARCLRLAHGLRQRGHNVVLVLKDVRLPAGHDAAEGLTVLQAPLTPHSRADRRMPSNYADVLRNCGYADVQDVTARLVAWRDILALTRPAVVVGDHAPTAQLAARLAGIPHMAVGTGFAVPPATYPWPSIRPWEPIQAEALIVAEQKLDRVVEAAQRALGYPASVRVRDLFGACDVLDTFPELDHYGERTSGRYVGPIVSVPNARRVSWQDNAQTKVLAYLRPAVPGFAKILRALARLDVETLCVAPGLPSGMAQRFATRRLRIALAAVDLPLLFEHADLAISYGNAGFSTQALLAGVPLLMRPQYVEQALFSRRVEDMGAGQLLDIRTDPEAVTDTLQWLLNSEAHRHAAQAFRKKYRRFLPEQAVGRAVDVIANVAAENGVKC